VVLVSHDDKATLTTGEPFPVEHPYGIVEGRESGIHHLLLSDLRCLCAALIRVRGANAGGEKEEKEKGESSHRVPPWVEPCSVGWSQVVFRSKRKMSAGGWEATLPSFPSHLDL
jgi:hypothetical protein